LFAIGICPIPGGYEKIRRNRNFVVWNLALELSFPRASQDGSLAVSPELQQREQNGTAAITVEFNGGRVGKSDRDILRILQKQKVQSNKSLPAF
jgi:hypothetical protein